jgi:hypothetical protein
VRPGDKETLLRLSQCRLVIGDYTAAIKAAEDTLADDPSFYRGVLQKAEALYAGGNFEYSLVLYFQGSRLRPDKREFNLGIQKSQDAISRSYQFATPELLTDAVYEVSQQTALNVDDVTELYVYSKDKAKGGGASSPTPQRCGSQVSMASENTISGGGGSSRANRRRVGPFPAAAYNEYSGPDNLKSTKVRLLNSSFPATSAAFRCLRMAHL